MTIHSNAIFSFRTVSSLGNSRRESYNSHGIALMVTMLIKFTLLILHSFIAALRQDKHTFTLEPNLFSSLVSVVKVRPPEEVQYLINV